MWGKRKQLDKAFAAVRQHSQARSPKLRLLEGRGGTGPLQNGVDGCGSRMVPERGLFETNIGPFEMLHWTSFHIFLEEPFLEPVF